MAIETFTWCTQVQGSGGSSTEENSVREVQFGNGYIQSSSAGFNETRRLFTVVYAADDWADMVKFVRAHTIKPFIWRTPEGDLALFRTKAGTVAGRVVSPKVREITCVFVEQFTNIK